jgi:hypothetical protein
MALITLKGISEINGLKILDVTDFPDDKDVPEDVFCVVNHDEDYIGFKLQNGPIKEAGLNGCQVTDIIQVAKFIIEKLNEKFPCRENDNTITYLDYAIYHQEARTKNRVVRGVEGHSEL